MPDPDAPTEQHPQWAQGDKPGFHVRMFGSPQFFHLWVTQVASATGDWLGFLAIAALAARICPALSRRPRSASVMSARIVPGFFLGAASGVIVDRFDRKRVMVTCDLGRAAVLVTLPFVDTVVGLVVASLVLECFTLLWTPAKEASVPNLVPPDHLTTANSLSLGGGLRHDAHRRWSVLPAGRASRRPSGTSTRSTRCARTRRASPSTSMPAPSCSPPS